MMTEHNQKVFNKLIEDLEKRRLTLFKIAAQIDGMIDALESDSCTYETDKMIDSCISARGNFLIEYLHNAGLGRDEELEEIFKAAIGNFKV